jgi:hypothetical protein
MTRPRVAKDSSWCKRLADQVIDGKYKLLTYVGAGKIGFVYKAQRLDLPEAIFALKLTFDQLREGWETEVRKVAQLAIVEGVAHFHDLGTGSMTQEGGPHFFQYTVWDFIAPGENLRAHLKRVGRVQTAFLVAVMERTLHVLNACHKIGVARHGDLHAGNILIGDQIEARLDDELQPRAPIFITDFGYGATGGTRTPKDDYIGLARVINLLLDHVDREKATATDRQILRGVKTIFEKLLTEVAGAERQAPLALLTVLRDLRRSALGGEVRRTSTQLPQQQIVARESPASVGEFQVSEMIGERWNWWTALFVPTVPARTRILALNIPTVVTGPRGCGKTMLFRRLSERWIVECGPVPELPSHTQFAALYVNANDFADAFARFSEHPTADSEKRLVCYANLCVLSELLSVESSRVAKYGDFPSDSLLSLVADLIVSPRKELLIQGEDRLQHYRSELEEIKWRFSAEEPMPQFSGFSSMSQIRWLPHFLTQLRGACSWFGDRVIVLFIDDYSLPRVTPSMQKILNRVLLQRSPAFLTKIATEASTTFLAEDSSGKYLQDGDDYQLIDIGEEALFLEDSERQEFLSAVFARRLQHDTRIPDKQATIRNLLSQSGISKTAFARQLRAAERLSPPPSLGAALRRRGRAAARVHYHGENVFTDLWSGDTRTMIQLITDIVENAPVGDDKSSRLIKLPVDAETQDRTFRNRGGEWLMSNTRNEPTDNAAVKKELARITRQRPGYQLQGTYGEHLKAIVEAFVEASRHLLLGPTYRIGAREVPRMAFRLEIVDEFRVEGLAREIYRDLIRFGLFMRDNRGKSVRGAFVPRLYLRRLLLPYARLALSKRDSVPLPCASFVELLLEPDKFKTAFGVRRRDTLNLQQIELPFSDAALSGEVDRAYDDIANESPPSPKPRAPQGKRRAKPKRQRK